MGISAARSIICVGIAAKKGWGVLMGSKEAGRESRLTILRIIRRNTEAGEKSTCRSIAAEMPISHAAVGYHVQDLTRRGILKTKRHGSSGGIWLAPDGAEICRELGLTIPA